MDELKVNQFGHARFAFKKKGFNADIDCYATIIDIVKFYVLLRDNDDCEYIVKKSNLKFEQEGKVTN